MRRVGIYYNLAVDNPHSGMGVYVSSITKNLKKLSSGISYFPFSYDKSATKKSENILGKVIVVMHELLYLQWSALKNLMKHRADIVYFPNPPVPILSPIPIVLTIPDLSFYYDKSMSPIIKTYLYLTYFLSAHKAHGITTFSHSSKKDIVRILKINHAKVSIITPAVKENYIKLMKKNVDKAVVSKLGITNQFILAVPGTFVPRKNMQDLLVAFDRLPTKLKDITQIVMIGRTKDSYFTTFYATCQKMGLAQSIVAAGSVSDQDLINLYKSAKVFVYPSLYEGFGLPPLEAMGCKTPTIAYNKSSLPEVLGTGAIFVNNPKELSRALLRVFTDKTYADKYANQGSDRYKLYSWEKSAQELDECIRKILKFH